MKVPLSLLAAAALPVLAAPAPIPPEAVAIVFNSDDASSANIATYYAEARQIPEGNLVGLPITETGTISRADYDAQIRDPLAEVFEEKGWWQRARDASGLLVPVKNRIRVLVCVRGVPYRIARVPVPPPPEGSDEKPPAPAPLERDEAAVDSELNLLGISGYKIAGPMKNPYFKMDRAITEAPLDPILLVTRLDAPTEADCKRLVDDALAAEQEGLWGMAYLDLALKGQNYKMGDDWIEAIAKRNAEVGIPTVIDRARDTFVTNYPMRDAALYFGWYTGHRNGPFLDPEFTFARGAVAAHLHSFSATDPRNASRFWVGPIIAKGASATVGNVYEPYLHLTHHFDILHDRLLKGYTLAEAATMSSPAFSWQNLVVGDPLYRPFAKFSEIDAASGEAREFKALRTAFLRWPDEPATRLTKIRTAAARMNSGWLYEALGLGFADMGLNDQALAAFDSAKRLFPAPADKLRQDLHRVDMARHAGDKQEAIAQLRTIETVYEGTGGAKAITGLLNILDPPPPPAATPEPDPQN